MHSYEEITYLVKGGIIVQRHTKVYYNHFGLDESDTPMSELTNEPAQDLHHIYPKGLGGRKTFIHEGVTYDIDDINNLIAVTRRQHDVAHGKIKGESYTKTELWDCHQVTLARHIL